MYNVFNNLVRRHIMAITKDMIIREVVQASPDAAEILMSFGMGCVGCPASQMETLEEAAAVHAMDLNKLLDALNK